MNLPHSRGSRSGTPMRSIHSSQVSPSPRYVASTDEHLRRRAPVTPIEMYRDTADARTLLDEDRGFYTDAFSRRGERIKHTAGETTCSYKTVNVHPQLPSFPLANHGDEVLRAMYQHRGSKLSLILSQESLATIAKYSDDLASAILDDLLLVCCSFVRRDSHGIRHVMVEVNCVELVEQDTVELLNDEELRLTRHHVDLYHTSQLDAILDQIRHIEEHEEQLIQKGFALGYSVPNQPQFVGLGHTEQPTAGISQEAASGVATSSRSNLQDTEPLVLPLGVVMELDVPAQPQQDHQRCYPDFASNLENGLVPTDEAFDSSLISAPMRAGKGRALSTSILHGRRYLAIEKRRQKFESHRRLAEASLAGTGMEQWAVVEMCASTTVVLVSLLLTPTDIVLRVVHLVYSDWRRCS